MDLWTRIRPLALPMPLHDRISRTEYNSDYVKVGFIAAVSCSLYLAVGLPLAIIAGMQLMGLLAAHWVLVIPTAGIGLIISAVVGSCAGDQTGWKDNRNVLMAWPASRLARKTSEASRIEGALEKAQKKGASVSTMRRYTRQFMLLCAKENRIQLVKDELHGDDKAKALQFIQTQKSSLLNDIANWSPVDENTLKARVHAKRGIKEMRAINGQLAEIHLHEQDAVLESQAQEIAEKELAQITSRFAQMPTNHT